MAWSSRWATLRGAVCRCVPLSCAAAPGQQRLCCHSTNGSTNGSLRQLQSSERDDNFVFQENRGGHSSGSSSGALSRRRALATTCAVLASPAIAAECEAISLPEAADAAWERMGGGPADLVFPTAFLGTWDVESVLVSVDLPLGPSFVSDMAVVQRAESQDKGRVVCYQAAFMRNARGQVVTDRRFNTASLMHTYMGLAAGDVARRITWNPDDPNSLQMRLPGGMQIGTRVMRRSEEQPAADRLATSEYFQQLIEEESRPQPRIKASQAFTKYHWRSDAAAAADVGPMIVATQLVSDYVSAEDPVLMMQAKGRPVTVYTYRMAFRRSPAASA